MVFLLWQAFERGMGEPTRFIPLWFCSAHQEAQGLVPEPHYVYGCSREGVRALIRLHPEYGDSRMYYFNNVVANIIPNFAVSAPSLTIYIKKQSDQVNVL